MTGRDRDDGDRPRLSWREIDQLRDSARRRSEAERRPRGAAAEARAREAARQYLSKVDQKLFAGGGRAGELARALREAHGTRALAEACRAYAAELGYPEDPSLLSLFLDAGDREVVTGALRKLAECLRAGAFRPGAGLRSQVRLLADDSDDGVAAAAEDALELL